MRSQRQTTVSRQGYLPWTRSTRTPWLVPKGVRQLLASNPAIPSPAPTTPVPSGEVDWKAEDHWTALTSYMADMYFPNEG